MATEIPKSDNANTAHQLIQVPPSNGVEGGVVWKLTPSRALLEKHRKAMNSVPGTSVRVDDQLIITNHEGSISTMPVPKKARPSK